MNRANEGTVPGRKRNGRGWNEAGEKSESHQREEILELLWTMREKGPVRVEEFLKITEEAEADHLLRKMEHDGWISFKESQVVFLEKGERRAEEIIRRHRLAERLLSEVFELEEKYMEPSACQFEHILSPQVLDSVCTFLGHPPICPHGKPIPKGPCCTRFKREMEPLVRPLSDLKLGEEGRIVFITPRSRIRLERLSSMGLIPGSVVKLNQKRPSFVLEVGETTLALDEDIVREIYVKKTK
ncbi:MAG: metal-dependent transcriptional regulator [Deltaproteobacteria bacterium]|nr:metal-dependent transcriptional regulator [Deltaproteobacteria bacterium]